MQEKDSKNATGGYRNRYPVATLIISNFVPLAIYGIGAYIMFWVGMASLAMYLAFIIILEILLYTRSCKNCYYYGKLCAFGKGKIACLITKQGNPDIFAKKPVSWKSIIPDLLVTVIPMITAVVLMIIDFHWILPVLLVLLILLSSAGNSYVRGTLACKYCRQRELGCPAQKLFIKDKPANEPTS
ncbi:MAG: hypothetical protein JW762_14750 [Dehalococcoidales bacterium]|nr:hypothetical protein [Dehalococcoidales bacterium]